MKKIYSWEEIVNEFYPHFCELAAEVGIDGAKLLTQLPRSGELLSGKDVPVLSAKYRQKCTVLFYINPLPNGGTWPYFKFMSFKHGGVSCEFNGLRLVKNRVFGYANLSQQAKRVKPIITQSIVRDDESKAQWRKDVFWANAEQYFNGEDAIYSNWVKQRFKGMMNTNCLARADLRLAKNGHLLVPISHNQHGLIGYHKIFDDEQNQKRHQIIQSGLLKGSAVIIKPSQGIENPNIGITEGLATGLSIALVWSGTIYVALSAWNLADVRSSIAATQKVTFFADNDAWKPNVGNTGIEKAKNAASSLDTVIAPYFNQQSLLHKPTDFNDLLQLEGIKILSLQVNQVQ